MAWFYDDVVISILQVSLNNTGASDMSCRVSLVIVIVVDMDLLHFFQDTLSVLFKLMRTYLVYAMCLNLFPKFDEQSPFLKIA